jgi:hypothetical protein
MTPGEIVATIARGGGIVERVEIAGGERLRVSPPGFLTPDLREAVQREKAGVLDLLRLLNGGTLLEYAGDVLGFEAEPTAADLIDEAEPHGTVLYVRHRGDVGIRHGDGIPDELLLTLARGHVRLLEALEQRQRSCSASA